MTVGAPERLGPQHDVSAFDSGETALDEWLRRRALANEESGASRTYVVCVESRVAGYYSLAAGAAAHEGVPGRVRRNMPDPIPVMILGRLAVDREFQSQGVGVGLLKDAVLRTVQAAEIAGIRALLVHAISDKAKRFYERYGFLPSPLDPMTVVITLRDAELMFQAARGKR
ncbi:MAG: GNAT family N-acetyltransferase [Acidobacteria bacterium]|nr:GNAT family N-acetyltransferase [Acidobacteriota bacterium]